MSVLEQPTTLIDGKWGDPAGRREITNPATGAVIASIGYGGAAEAVAAAEAAATAFGEWSVATARTRADLLADVGHEVLADADRIGELLARESGKRLPEAVAEVRFAAEYFRWFGEQARRPSGEIMPHEAPGRRHFAVRRPSGVAVCLTPWNFPVSIPARKIAAALAAGSTLVTRVSEKAPLAAVELFRCMDRAGIPAGVVNLVHGPAAELTEALLAHPAVRVVSFTGSTEVGRHIMQLASRRIVRPALELGGDAAFVVFEDADLDAAADGAMIAKFRNNGQSCIAANRFLIHEAVYDAFVERFVARVDAMTIGDPLAGSGPDLGPLIDRTRVDAVADLADDAVRRGGRVLTRRFDLPAEGCYAAPVVVADLPDDAKLSCSEAFGPIAGLFRFDSEEEALHRANATEMGLAGYVYTRDLARADRMLAGLEAGIVGVNNPLPSAAFAPMGGVKQSGLGREGGVEGLAEFQDIHYASVAV